MSVTDSLRETLHRIENTPALDSAGKALQAAAGPLTRSDTTKSALSGTWLGHRLHPLLTDVPIGAWASAAFLDVFGGRHSSKAARRLVGIGILAALPTAAAGLSDWEDTYGGEQRIATTHALVNATGLTLQLLSWRARGKGHGLRGRMFSALALGAVVAGGYLGGHLVYNMRAGVDVEQGPLDPGDWHDAVAMDELVDEHPHTATVDGASVVLVRRGTNVYALSATCSHAGGPLGEGKVEGNVIQCPWHGSRFRLGDGSIARGPAVTPQCAYETRVTDGKVQVRLRAREERGVDLTVV
ncbi:MAG TPA: Rieske 2Fe-2S domain-containing protein [Acidimicrobiia bacterium]|nr:Rieske 2Fe-2S domain-containing protein [Acidimicrobiia bacterium]